MNRAKIENAVASLYLEFAAKLQNVLLDTPTEKIEDMIKAGVFVPELNEVLQTTVFFRQVAGVR